METEGNKVLLKALCRETPVKVLFCVEGAGPGNIIGEKKIVSGFLHKDIWIYLSARCGVVSKLESSHISFREFRDGFSCLASQYTFNDCFLRFTSYYSSCFYNGECY